MNQSHHTETERKVFKKLSYYYFLAIGMIALAIVCGGIFMVTHIKNQQSESRLINLAGRQRMLSQKLSKEYILVAQGVLDRSEVNISNDLKLWIDTHQAIRSRSSAMGVPGRNSEEVEKVLDSLESSFQEMVKVLSGSEKEDWQSITSPLKVHQTSLAFLGLMDKAVFLYDAEASAKLVYITRLERLLVAISLMILILEILFIFRPATLYVRRIINELVLSKSEADGLAAQNRTLYEEKEKNLDELKAVHFALDQTSMYANVDDHGKIIHMSSKLAQLLGLHEITTGLPFTANFTDNPENQEYLNRILKSTNTKIWSGELLVSKKDKSYYLDTSIVPVYRRNMVKDFLILCTDISRRKATQKELAAMVEEKHLADLEAQKASSVQIVSTQEDERKRIARDMHDGIGQMLTALKFNLESIEGQGNKELQEKIQELKGLAGKIIQEVRTTTFNLTPPELGDHGILSGIKKMVEQFARLTQKNIVYHFKGDRIPDFPPLININLYRIVQEALNNAIKYSDASMILVNATVSSGMVSIKVQDNGKGFDLVAADTKYSGSGSGHGLENMRERAKFINARVYISSTPGQGTIITLNLPLE